MFDRLITEAAPKGNDHGHKFKILICCQRCRSDNVRRDAYASWSVADQVWELSSVFDDGMCDDCGAESTLVERHVDMDGKDAGPVSSMDLFDGETIPLNPMEPREFATIMAALRFWQRGAFGVPSKVPEQMIATDEGTLEPLTCDEIDALCERLNQ